MNRQEPYPLTERMMKIAANPSDPWFKLLAPRVFPTLK